MSRTRRTASSKRDRTKRKWRVSPRSAAAKTMPQRSRTAAALNSAVAALAETSLVEGTAFGAAELLLIRNPRRGEIAGGLLRLDLDGSIERHQPVRDRDLLDHLDPLRLERVVLQVRHRDPAIDPADPEPMKDIRHQLLKPHVLHAGDAFRAAEIGVGPVAAQLALAGVVDEEFGDFAERPPLLAVVDNDPDSALLCCLDAKFDAMHEIGAASANVRAKDIRAVALVVDAASDHGARVSDPLDLAKKIDCHATDRRQQDLDVGPGDELGEHPPALLEECAAEVGLRNPETGGKPGQMPYGVDCGLGDANLAVVEQHFAVGTQASIGEKRPQLRCGDSRLGDRDRRTCVDARADVFRENLSDEVAPRIERHDLPWVGPLRIG